MVFIAVGAFIAMFSAFVVLPTLIQKRHAAKEREDFAPAGDG